MTATDAVIAASRFGLGARPGETARIAADPRGWLAAQIRGTPVPPPTLAGLPSGAATLTAFLEQRRERREARRAASGDDPAAPNNPSSAPAANDPAETAVRERRRAAYLQETGLRTLAMVRSDTPFLDRLVAFWSNHFTVSVQRPVVLPVAGAFEREAIRPHVLGRFGDMLLAATRHPAMLLYLDNAVSAGPNSRFGQRRGKGLNENLAREILELHTLGVDGGYTQQDVTRFAAILTGWSVARVGDADSGSFLFRPAMHEPGDKLLLGRRYAEDGAAEAEAALAALAAHPATARHIATKLVRHFVADDPPAGAVERLARTFTTSGGDLRAVSAALIALPEAWAQPWPKIRSPQDFVVAACRATGAEPEPERLVRSLVRLGQAPFAAPSPAGWPDRADQWIGPEAVLRRIDWATGFAAAAGTDPNPLRLADALYGDALSPTTREAVARAPSAEDGLTLLLAAPEFQRR
jgi:uncharacterized protein (DUF1800 family)